MTARVDARGEEISPWSSLGAIRVEMKSGLHEIAGAASFIPALGEYVDRAPLSNYLKSLTHESIEQFLRQLVWFLQSHREEPHEEARDVRYHLGSA